MKHLLTVDLVAQKMAAYAAYRSVQGPQPQWAKLGARPTMFDRVAQMLNGCSAAGHVGGRLPRGGVEGVWAEVAAESFREFPITNFQVRHVRHLVHSLTHLCLN